MRRLHLRKLGGFMPVERKTQTRREHNTYIDK